MTERRILARRTLGSGPPSDLLFGEIAYSDGDRQVYVGRPEPEPPTVLTPGDNDQSAAIDGLAADIVLLDSSQTTQDVAIAALETDQDAQNAAIAALTTTTSDQAAALAALAPVATSGAYADLSGKPSLFSGAYADLTGKPTISAGFTYDQQTEPVGPAAGATWRERSAGGQLVGQWEWIGAVSEWVSLTSYEISTAAAIGSASGSLSAASVNFTKRLIISRTVIAFRFSGNTFSSSNFHTYTPQLKDTTDGLVSNLGAAILNSPSLIDKTPVNLVRTFSNAGLFLSVTGSPGSSKAYLSLEVRNCRA